MKKLTPLILIGVGFLIQGCETPGEGFHERHMQAAEDSGKAVAVSGGQSFEVSRSCDATFDVVATYLKKKNYTIEAASRDAGQITTALTITGGWRQTGTRVQITLIKESDTATTVKVTVTQQHRYNALQVDPWSDPATDDASSAVLATDLKAGI